MSRSISKTLGVVLVYRSVLIPGYSQCHRPNSKINLPVPFVYTGVEEKNGNGLAVDKLKNNSLSVLHL